MSLVGHSVNKLIQSPRVGAYSVVTLNITLNSQSYRVYLIFLYLTQKMHDTGSFFSLGHSSRSSSSGRSTCSTSSSMRGYSGLSDDQTPVRRRDTVTITTLKLARFLMPSIQYQPSLKGQALENVKNLLEDVTAELQELKEDRRVLLQKVESLQESNAVDDGKIPPEISVSLKIINNYWMRFL